MIFVWSQLKLSFNDLEGRQLWKFKRLTEYEDIITDIVMLDKYKYFVTSTHQGNLLVWKLAKKKSLIHEFKSHTKKVTSL